MSDAVQSATVAASAVAAICYVATHAAVCYVSAIDPPSPREMYTPAFCILLATALLVILATLHERAVLFSNPPIEF